MLYCSDLAKPHLLPFPHNKTLIFVKEAVSNSKGLVEKAMSGTVILQQAIALNQKAIKPGN